MSTTFNLPAHINQFLGIDGPIDKDSLGTKVEEARDRLSAFRLNPEEIVESLCEGPLPDGAITIVPQGRILENWMSVELLRDGRLEFWAIIIPNDDEQITLVTASGQFLIRLWMTDESVLLPNVAPGNLILYIPNTCSHIPFARKLITDWSLTCQVSHSITPSWVGQRQLLVAEDSLILQADLSSYNDLFTELLYEPKVKWRFLSMYRVFEHGYLNAVFEIIKNNFIQNPKQSLVDAQEALDSELNQLTNLIQNKDLITHFEELHDAFANQVTQLNRYACAINHSIGKSGWLKRSPKKWEKGVMIFYKLRCSIVHAGQGTPVYESYEDAPICIAGLLEKCEIACLGFLRITIR